MTTMGRNLGVGALVLAAGLAAAGARGDAGAAPAAVAGNVKADVGLFPNDFGPPDIDVSGYPKEMRLKYKTFAFKCAACHTIARPINSQFVEFTEAEIAKAKKDQPDLFKEPLVWKIEPKIWSRYVKRMMGKPGCPVQGADGKDIYTFLVYDGRMRKTGEHAAEWREQRARLVAEFAKKYPETYKNLYPNTPVPVVTESAAHEATEQQGGAAR